MTIPKFRRVGNTLILSCPKDRVNFNQLGIAKIGDNYQVETKNLLLYNHHFLGKQVLESIIELVMNSNTNDCHFIVAELNNSFYEFNKNFISTHPFVNLKISSRITINDDFFSNPEVNNQISIKSSQTIQCPILVCNLNSNGILDFN